MDKSCDNIRNFMIEPVMKKLYDVERRLTILENKIEHNNSIHEQEQEQKQELKVESEVELEVEKEITLPISNTNKQISKIAHPKPTIMTIKNGFFLNSNTKLDDIKLKWNPVKDVSRYIIEEKCLSINTDWYRSRLTQANLKNNYIYIAKFGNKLHENWGTMGTKLKITGMMGKFQWRYIPVYYINGKEIEGEPSKPSDIWENKIINY